MYIVLVADVNNSNYSYYSRFVLFRMFHRELLTISQLPRYIDLVLVLALLKYGIICLASLSLSAIEAEM